MFVFTVKFYVTNGKGPILLGLSTCKGWSEKATSSNVIDYSDGSKGDSQTSEQILREHADLFEEIRYIFKIFVDTSV